jgi:Nucleotidyl transferase AbiEii toxin, Type IV TA system
MADLFLKLPAGDRREALGVAAASSGRPLHLLDKDVWLVWILEVLFQSPFANHPVFEGGSSLSKAYQIISRFSEDVDLTYDIRALATDLVGEDVEPLPPNRSQEKRWTKEIRTRLPLWINDEVMPVITSALSEQGLAAELSMDGEKLFIAYNQLATGSGYGGQLRSP